MKKNKETKEVPAPEETAPAKAWKVTAAVVSYDGRKFKQAIDYAGGERPRQDEVNAMLRDGISKLRAQSAKEGWQFDNSAVLLLVEGSE